MSTANRSVRLSLAAALCLLVVTCGQPRRFHGDPVPEGAENPLEILYRGGTVPDAVGAVVKSLSDLGITPTQASRGRGYVETDYIDVSAFERFVETTYPGRELLVEYQITVGEAERPTVHRILIRAVYRPTLVDRDRLVPLDHPGFTLALRIGDRLELNLIEAGMKIVEPPEGTEEQEGETEGSDAERRGGERRPPAG